MAQFKVKGILSFPRLFTAVATNEGDDPKFSTVVLIRKDDPQVAVIQGILETEKANGFPSGFPVNGKVFFKDCTDAFPTKPELAGYMCLSSSSKAEHKPSVVDAGLNPVIDPATVYAGAEAWVALNTFTYNHTMNKGVSAGLNAVMLTGLEGELGRLDNRPSAQDLFADVGVAAPVPSL